MITLSFNVTKDDMLALACNHYASSPTVQKARLTYQVAISFLLALLGLLTVIAFPQLKWVGVVLVLCAIVAIFLVPVWHGRELRNMADKMFSEASCEKTFGKYTLTLTDDGLLSASPLGEGKYKWAAVNSVAFTPAHLFIFLAGLQGWAIPRSQVPESVLQEAKTFIESHIPAARL